MIEAPNYPFNTSACGRRSVERYVELKLKTQKPGKPWFGPDAAASSSVGNGKTSFDLALAPFDLCGVDAHDLPVIGVVRVNGPKGPQNIAVRRIWIYATVDFLSGVVPGYSASIRVEPTSLMIEKAFEMAQTPWVPRKLDMHNVHYAEGAGFPVGTIEGLDGYPKARVVTRFTRSIRWSRTGSAPMSCTCKSALASCCCLRHVDPRTSDGVCSPSTPKFSCNCWRGRSRGLA